MHIIHCIDTLEYGGSPTYLRRVVHALDRRGHTQEVWCCNRMDPAIVAGFPERTPVVRLGLARYATGAGLARLARRIRLGRVDCVHTLLPFSDALGRAASALTGVPAVCSIQGHYTPWQLRLGRLTAPFCAHCMVIAETLKQFTMATQGIPAHKISIVPNGLDPAPFDAASRAEGRARLQAAEADMVFACVARLGPEKDHATLLKAFAMLAGAPRLVLVGEGPCRPAIEADIARLGLAGRVQLLGNRDDVPTLLAGSDAFVLSSEHEGMPNVLLEAMAAGLPVAATAVGGVPEVVADGETGLLAPAKDPAALAEAMGRLADDAALRQSLGQAGRRRLEALFSFDAMVNAMESVFFHASFTR